jgi:Flp pilus assembly protein TadD
MTYHADIEAAGKFLQKGEYKRVLKSALSAARKAPNQPVARNLAGIALGATGRPKEAIVQFQKALKLHPDFGEAQKNLAQTYILIGRGDSAVTILTRTAAKTPEDWKVWALMAQAQGSIGQDTKARECADTAIRLAPKYGPNYHLRSSILMRMGKIKDAIVDLETALRINPADVLALTNLSLPLAR